LFTSFHLHLYVSTLQSFRCLPGLDLSQKPALGRPNRQIESIVSPPARRRQFNQEIQPLSKQFDSAARLVIEKSLSPFFFGDGIKNYILTVAVIRPSSASPFAKWYSKPSILPSLPPAPWIVTDSTIRRRYGKGVFDRNVVVATGQQGLSASAAMLRRPSPRAFG